MIIFNLNNKKWDEASIGLNLKTFFGFVRNITFHACVV